MEQMLLRRSEVATILHLHPRTLTEWKRVGYGPLPIKLGRCIFYLASDVESFLRGQIEVARQDQAERRAAVMAGAVTVDVPADDLLGRIEAARADQAERAAEFERNLPEAVAAVVYEAEKAVA